MRVLGLDGHEVRGVEHVGGFFGVDAWGGTDFAGDFIGAFGNTDATVGLPWGSILALIGIIGYLILYISIDWNS